MDSVIRAAVVYLILLVVFRFAGKRALAQITTFDFVLLLIISEAVQNGLVDDDHSITNAVLVVVTLIMIDIGFSLLKRRSKRVEKVLDSLPIVIVEQGRVLEDRMARARVEVEDVLGAAREMHGLMRLADVRYAVLERDGTISVIPQPGATA
jgi:uncharacterized membrane protein YcaP (DUF421 family)